MRVQIRQPCLIESPSMFQYIVIKFMNWKYDQKIEFYIIDHQIYHQYIVVSTGKKKFLFDFKCIDRMSEFECFFCLWAKAQWYHGSGMIVSNLFFTHFQ